MTRRRSLLVIWALFALLLAGILVFKRGEQAPLPVAQQRFITAEFAELGAVEIVTAGAYHRFERGADGLWFYHTHAPGSDSAAHEHLRDADASARIAATLGAFTDIPIVETRGPLRDPEARGLAPPALFVVLYRPQEDRPLARYSIGRLARDSDELFAAAHGEDLLVTIPASPVTALQSLVEPYR